MENKYNTVYEIVGNKCMTKQKQVLRFEKEKLNSLKLKLKLYNLD